MKSNEAELMAHDLDAKNLTVLGNKNGQGSDVIVAYSNDFKGKSYFHIRTVWKDKNGNWKPGKGLSFDPNNVKDIVETLSRTYL